jgi:hypothetical protein
MPKFYDYNGQKYSNCFPIEWATNHFEKTGPFECMNCLHYGCVNSIFTTYCINCQEYEYNYTRIVGNNSTIGHSHSYNDSDISDDDISYGDISDDEYNSNYMYISSVMPLFTSYNNTYSQPITYQDDGQLNLSPQTNIIFNNHTNSDY